MLRDQSQDYKKQICYFCVPYFAKRFSVRLRQYITSRYIITSFPAEQKKSCNI